MIKIITPFRGTDQYGSGEYGSSRGSRTHKGVDWLAPPKAEVYSLTDGVITRHGFPYADDLSFRYVEVETKDKHYIRYFYVHPVEPIGSIVTKDSIIGLVQYLDKRYKGIPNHIHLEVLDPERKHINPRDYFNV